MILPLLFVAQVATPPASPPGGERPHVPLLDHAELQIAMARVAAEHPSLVSVVPVGTSRGGRRIDALRVAAGELAPGRPAILLVANLDGPWVYTSSIAIAHADALANRYAADEPGNETVRALLDSTTLYILPRANPDAAEARFKKPLEEVQATGAGVDNDRDGRSGEDAPSDLDEDGMVTSMRVPDPDGEWIADPTDARVLVKADRKKGEHGKWKLFPEGRDSDKDERAGEDPEHDAIVDRNFPEGWQEHRAEFGTFATDEPEARALCEFVLAHKDVALVLTYGERDNMVEKPATVKDDAPAVKRVPPPGVLESDADLLAEIGKRYKRVTQNKTKGKKDEGGSFSAWCQAQRGLWVVDLALWRVPTEKADKPDKKDGKGGDKKSEDGDAKEKDTATSTTDDKGAPAKDGAKKEGAGDAAPPKGDAAPPKGDAPAPKGDAPASKGEKGDKPDEDKPTPSEDAQRLAWFDAHGESARFVPWHAYRHPEFGDVEIGGIAPYALIEPPDSERDAIAAKELDFLITLGDLLPRVRVAECTAKNLAGGVWEIEAAIENDALLPYLSKAAQKSRAVRPARVTLRLPSGAALLAGPRQELVSDLAGSGGRAELRWLVSGAPPSAIEVEVDTDHAGVVRRTPEVK